MERGRDRLLLWLLLAHLPLALFVALLQGSAPLFHAFGEAGSLAAVAGLAYWQLAETRAFRAVGAALLMLFSGLLIHLGTSAQAHSMDDAGRTAEQMANAAEQVSTQAADLAEATAHAKSSAEAGADAVQQAVDGISTVAETTASATAEMSSASQEMAGTMEQMRERATDLAATADQLRGLVEQFRLVADAPATAAPRKLRRAS